MKIRARLKSYRIDSESEALSGAVSKFSMFVQEKSDPTDVCMVLESQVEHVIRKTREEILVPHCQPTAGELEGLGVVPGHVRAAGVRGRHSELSVSRA
ncbi:hypothetical protein MRX96_059011 [Rhipicephalus microplus]